MGKPIRYVQLPADDDDLFLDDYVKIARILETDRAVWVHVVHSMYASDSVINHTVSDAVRDYFNCKVV